MIVADVRRRLFQRRNQLRVAGVVRIVQHLRLDNVRRLAVKPLGVLHDRIPAALLYVRHHTADNLLNIAARTSRTGFHFADDLLLCLSVREDCFHKHCGIPLLCQPFSSTGIGINIP